MTKKCYEIVNDLIRIVYLTKKELKRNKNAFVNEKKAQAVLNERLAI